MSFKIEITALSGVSAGDVFRFPLKPGDAVTIGRSPECQLVLQDSGVSRAHAKIELSNRGLLISDLGSSFGTVHMGFQLRPGEDGARGLRDGDEIKVGQQILRINFAEDVIVVGSKPAEHHSAASLSQAGSAGNSAAGVFARFAGDRRRGKRVKIGLAAVGVVGLIALLIVPSDEPTFPIQDSRPIAVLPHNGVVGLWKGDKEDGGSDDKHIDRASFKLPSSNLVVDFDYIGDVPVKLFLDDTLITELPPASAWERKQLIVRDLRLGRERQLIFDNPDFPRPTPVRSINELKWWGVRAVRAQPIKEVDPSQLGEQFTAAVSASESIDNSPVNFFTTIKAVHSLILGVATEIFEDAAAYAINNDSRCPTSGEIAQLLSQMIQERNRDPSPETGKRHLVALGELAGKLEAELWRRVNSRFGRAKLAGAAKNYIDAHDTLKEVMSMFPDDSDYRSLLARKLFDNTDIVSKGVKKNPNKYRRRAKSQ